MRMAAHLQHMQTNHAQDAQGAQQVKSMVTVLHPNINYNRKESPFIVFRFFSSISFIIRFMALS